MITPISPEDLSWTCADWGPTLPYVHIQWDKRISLDRNYMAMESDGFCDRWYS